MIESTAHEFKQPSFNMIDLLRNSMDFNFELPEKEFEPTSFNDGGSTSSSHAKEQKT